VSKGNKGDEPSRTGPGCLCGIFSLLKLLTDHDACREQRNPEKMAQKPMRRSLVSLHRWSMNDLCLRICPTLSLFLKTSRLILQVTI